MNLSQLSSEINIVFQPIHDLISGEITGFEALTRGPAGLLHSPGNLFRAAARERILDIVEMICFKQALEQSDILPPGLIFFNFSPSTIAKQYKEILYCLNTGKLNSDKAVIELIEYAISDKGRYELIGILGVLRDFGLKIALDDVGSGDRDIGDICELPADIMKIDRRIIHGLSKHQHGNASRYQIILNSLVALAQKLKMSVVAEGIETERQLEGVKLSGIHLAQGYFLSRPRPAVFWLAKSKEGGVKIANSR